MKFGKLFICILLVLCMMLSLCACSGNDDKKDDKDSKESKEEVKNDKDDDRNDKEDRDDKEDRNDKEDSDDEDDKKSGDLEDEIIGTWEMELDMGTILAKTYFQNTGIKIDDTSDLYLPLCLAMQFDDDGACVVSIETEAYEDHFDDFIDAFTPILADYFYEYYEGKGMSKDELDEQNGGDLSDALLEEIEAVFAPDELFDGIREVSGTYELDGDQLVVSMDDSKETTATISIDGDEMEMIPDADSEAVGIEAPWIFERR